MEIVLHYYQFNIGDYASHTRHLSRDEDLAYRRLLDLYYLQEKPLPKEPEKCARLISMNECSTDVERVLNEFFTLDENGWVNKRADKEIFKYHGKSAQASVAGKASAEARKQRALSVGSTDVQPNKKHKPITNNQEPVKNNTRLPAFSRPPDVEESVWNDFCQHRKAQRATITQTAIDGIQKEAKKAGWNLEAALRECVLRGWRGFKAEWVREKSLNRQEALEARNRAVGDAWLAKETANETR